MMPMKEKKSRRNGPTLTDYKNFFELMEYLEEKKKKDKPKDDKKPDTSVKFTPGQVFMLMLIATPIVFIGYAYMFLSLVKALAPH